MKTVKFVSQQQIEAPFQKKKTQQLKHFTKGKLHVTYCKVDTQALAAPGVSAQRK